MTTDIAHLTEVMRCQLRMYARLVCDQKGQVSEAGASNISAQDVYYTLKAIRELEDYGTKEDAPHPPKGPKDKS